MYISVLYIHVCTGMMCVNMYTYIFIHRMCVNVYQYMQLHIHIYVYIKTHTLRNKCALRKSENNFIQVLTYIKQ